MVVVADTSPINYFVLIGQIDLLMQLHKRILIPLGVLAELEHPRAPNLVREWIVSSPKWLEVRSPKSNLILAQLDLGESEAIGLDEADQAGLVNFDDAVDQLRKTSFRVSQAVLLEISRRRSG